MEKTILGLVWEAIVGIGAALRWGAVRIGVSNHLFLRTRVNCGVQEKVNRAPFGESPSLARVCRSLCGPVEPDLYELCP